QRSVGGSLRLGFPLSENLWAQTSYTLAENDIFGVTNIASLGVLQASQLNGGRSLTSSFGTALTYDVRNHPKNPTRGYYLQVAADFAGAG
ncbi:BamA/TamA family outer membrane protein, partial [Acinetobacter baumannii]